MPLKSEQNNASSLWKGSMIKCTSKVLLGDKSPFCAKKSYTLKKYKEKLVTFLTPSITSGVTQGYI